MPPALYTEILSHHAGTGGSFGRLLDVGCGPGNATRDIAPNFADAVGTDGSVEMVNAARKAGGRTKEGMIRFEAANAEDLDGIQGLEAQSVDLITAAMAVRAPPLVPI